MYKDYNMTQLTLPLETSVLIPTNDMSRHVNDIVETIPKTEFDEFRHHRGATSYHPKMMLKVILYAYTQSVFSGRKIEKLLNDSIRMMWLSQNQKPSYKTINRFRVNPKVDALLESLFIQFHSQCLKQHLIDDQTIFIDGTKVEANANRYTFVWKKSIQNHVDDEFVIHFFFVINLKILIYFLRCLNLIKKRARISPLEVIVLALLTVYMNTYIVSFN